MYRGNKPLYQPLHAEGLFVVYAQNFPDYVRFPNIDEFESLGIETDALFLLAKENLLASLPERSIMEVEGGVYFLEADGRFEASFLLFDPTEIFDIPIKKELVVAIPAEDIFMLTDSANEIGVFMIRYMAEQFYMEASRPITDRLLVWRDGSYQYHDE